MWINIVNHFLTLFLSQSITVCVVVLYKHQIICIYVIVLVPIVHITGYLCGCKSASVCYTLKPTFAFRRRVSPEEKACVSHFSIHIHEAFLHFFFFFLQKRRKGFLRAGSKNGGRRGEQRRDKKKREYSPCRCQNQSCLVSQAARFVRTNMKDLTELTSLTFVLVFLCPSDNARSFHFSYCTANTKTDHTTNVYTAITPPRG